jgi:hypothetical protein
MDKAVVVRQATADDFKVFFGQMVTADVIEVNGSPVALGMVARRPDGRLWLSLNVRPGIEQHALKLVRATKQGLALLRERITEPVFADCNLFKHPRADHLLNLIGFRLTPEINEDLRVYCWSATD